MSKKWKNALYFHVITIFHNIMENKQKFRPNPRLKLMEQVRQVMRYHHYAYRTEKTYSDWILRYIKFHGGKTHPKNMGKNEIEAFLSHLATQGKVSASTQRQALNAIVFLYHKVLDIQIEEKIEPVKAKRHRRPPVVMIQSEVQRVLNQMHGNHLLMARHQTGHINGVKITLTGWDLRIRVRGAGS